MSEPSYKLADLQHMTRAELERACPQTNSSARAKGYKCDLKWLIKVVILAAKELHLPLKGDSGVREFWYSPVKPILFRAAPERVDRKSQMWEATFCSILSKLVKAKRLTYAALGISDFTTMRENYEQIDKALCWSHELLFIEKDQAYVHVVPVKKLLNCNIMSGGGWSHTAGIEDQIRGLLAKEINWVDVYTFGDYDAFGDAISEEFVSKCETLGLHVRKHVHIGINPTDLAPEVLAVQKYRIKLGRKLSVNGVSFDATEWLEKKGITEDGKIGHGNHGLEIEAVSAQPGGHDKLREIVALELLKYLKESDRIEEITKGKWLTAPLRGVWTYMNTRADIHLEYNDILNPPAVLPDTFLNRSDYTEQATPIEEKMESETEELQTEIDDLEEQLEALRGQKAKIEDPYRDELDYLSNEYERSHKLLAHCFWKYLQAHKAEFPREKYDLGLPSGCILDALKNNVDLQTFIGKANDTKIIEDIHKALTQSFGNDEVSKMVNAILKRASEESK